MREVIFIVAVLFCFVSNCAMAEWTKISTDSNFSTYVDLKTIKKDGNKVSLWMLIDHHWANDAGDNRDKSFKGKLVYDCIGKKKKSDYLTSHSRHMGGGETQYRQTSRNWEPVVPDSPDEALFKIACER